jgi:hypothetical protein
MTFISVFFNVALAVRGADPNLGADRVCGRRELLISALALATREIFAVALYRYANGSPNTGGFAEGGSGRTVQPARQARLTQPRGTLRTPL